MVEKFTTAQRARARASLKAQDVMQQPVTAAAPSASLRGIAAQFVDYELGGMPVVSADGRIVGVITEADIIRALNQGNRLDSLTAGSLMTAPPVTVDAEAPIDSVMKTLEEHCIVRVPVTRQKKLVGIIARRDVIRAILGLEFRSFGES